MKAIKITDSLIYVSSSGKTEIKQTNGVLSITPVSNVPEVNVGINIDGDLFINDQKISTFIGDTGSGGTFGYVPAPSAGDAAKYLSGNGSWQTITFPVNTQVIPIASSDETTAITTGNGKVVFRMPYAFTLSAVKASLTTAQSSGSVFTVDIKVNSVSILSTLITIDNTEKTSKTASTQPVISTSSLADDAEVSIDVTQVGDGTATGLKVYLIGTPV